MKRLMAAILLCSLLVATALGQGRLMFNNSEYTFGPSPVTIGPHGAQGEGAIGGYLGSNYTASLYYLPGTGFSQISFDQSNPVWYGSADTPFFGETGFPTGNFTSPRPGLFDGGVVTLPLIGTVTVEVRVWYNIGATSYEDALRNGFNVGESNPIEVGLTVFPITVPHLNDGFPGIIPFAVQPVPEPSFGAFGAAGAMLLALRWMKSKPNPSN